MRTFRCREILIPPLVLCLVCGSNLASAEGLREALQATLRNHPAVAGQEAEVAARRYAADGARSQRYPTFTAQAQQFREGDRSVLSGDDLSNPAVLRLRQPIWAFGRINSSIAAADAGVSMERADLLRVRRQLLEDTAVAYAEVRGSRERMEMARQNVRQLEQLHAQIVRRVEGQLASSADARLAATRLLQSRARVQQFVSEWETARDDLASLTQAPINADEPVPSGLLELPESNDLIDRALQQNAEIDVKRYQLGQAEAGVAQARTADMPTIYLQADRFNDQPGLRDDSQVSVVFEASLTGMGFTARGRRGEAEAHRMAAQQDLNATQLELRRQLERLQRSRRLQTELIELQTQSLGDLQSLLDSYQRQYETGTKSWLDLLNIQRELFEQRRQLVQARSDWQIYSLQLLAMIGGLDNLAGIQEQYDD
jgi:outer membrane protein, adhesin transport system